MCCRSGGKRVQVTTIAEEKKRIAAVRLNGFWLDGRTDGCHHSELLIRKPPWKAAAGRWLRWSEGNRLIHTHTYVYILVVNRFRIAVCIVECGNTSQFPISIITCKFIDCFLNNEKKMVILDRWLWGLSSPTSAPDMSPRIHPFSLLFMGSLL